MKKIFLGKPLHWLLLVILVPVGWYFGLQRAHVVHFNVFIVGLLCLLLFLLLLFLLQQILANRLPVMT